MLRLKSLLLLLSIEICTTNNKDILSFFFEKQRENKKTMSLDVGEDKN